LKFLTSSNYCCASPTFRVAVSETVATFAALRDTFFPLAPSFVELGMSVSTTRHVIILGESNCGKVRERIKLYFVRRDTSAERARAQALRRPISRRVFPHFGHRFAGKSNALAI
jgi:hypothetical protein